MMTLTDGISTFALDLVNWDGDAYVTVNVESRGFSGRNDLHVLGDVFTRFCSDLLALQRTLEGQAQITSVAPDELEVTIRRFDRLGHLSITGSTGYHVEMHHTSFWHCVTFGFQIDPAQLDAAVKVLWVQEHAT